MSTIVLEKKRCAICKRENMFLNMNSMLVLGLGDLDFRSNISMKGIFLDSVLQQCNNCKYIAADIELNEKSFLEFTNTELFRFFFCNDFKGVDSTVILFLKYAMYKEWEKKYDDAFEYCLKAAWKLDDLGEIEDAIKCRKKAIDISSNILKKSNQQVLTLVDLYRRTGQFEEVKRLLSDVKFEDNYYNKIAKFQTMLAKRQDKKCYCIEEALMANIDS